MTTRAWLGTELASSVLFAIPTIMLTTAGARHVAHYGEAWVSYILGVSWLWGPGLLLAVAVLLQSRTRWTRLGWQLSVLAGASMTLWSAFALWSFTRQGDVHWSLWAMWIAAALGAVLTISGAAALAPARQHRRSRLRRIRGAFSILRIRA